MQLISSISVNMVSLPSSQERVRLVRLRLFLVNIKVLCFELRVTTVIGDENSPDQVICFLDWVFQGIAKHSKLVLILHRFSIGQK